MKKVNELLAKTLSDFYEAYPDEVNIDDSQFEAIEKSYAQYMLNERGEPFIVDLIDRMCEQSLPPNLYNYWLIIKHQLSINRVGLVEENQFKSEANEARGKLVGETLKMLKLITSDSDAETPDWQDALNCCHLD